MIILEHKHTGKPSFAQGCQDRTAYKYLENKSVLQRPCDESTSNSKLSENRVSGEIGKLQNPAGCVLSRPWGCSVLEMWGISKTAQNTLFSAFSAILRKAHRIKTILGSRCTFFCRSEYTGVAKRVLPTLRESSRQVEAEVVSNSKNKLHQTWEALFWRPL